MKPDNESRLTQFAEDRLAKRRKFEETKDPRDFLVWLNFYTNAQRGDDELHALCSWAHAVVADLDSRRERREKAVREALSLLDFLCHDSLECRLAALHTHPDGGEISAAFGRLEWLIEELRV